MMRTPITTLISSVVKKGFSISSTPSRCNHEQSTRRKSSSRSACGRPSPTWQLTFHGPELKNPARAGTVIVRKWKRPGKARPFANSVFRPSRTASNYSVVVVTDAVDVPADWPASAGRFAQAEKPNAAAQATMRTIRI
jgi:hypothetical protein